MHAYANRDLASSSICRKRLEVAQHCLIRSLAIYIVNSCGAIHCSRDTHGDMAGRRISSTHCRLAVCPYPCRWDSREVQSPSADLSRAFAGCENGMQGPGVVSDMRRHCRDFISEERRSKCGGPPVRLDHAAAILVRPDLRTWMPGDDHPSGCECGVPPGDSDAQG